jgi:hypothetical protein
MKTKFLPALLLLIGIAMSFSGFSQVTLTVNVNLTGYTIGPGGVHLAGTFASTGCQTITSDWDPAAAGSEMELTTDNVYTIQLTYPSLSANQQLIFLVVRNNIWFDGYEDFSEGNPGVTSLNPSCGVDDSYGGFNRVLTIPASNAIFNAKFDHCGILNTCESPVNLLATNITATTALLTWTSASTGTKYQVRYKTGSSNWIVKNVSGVSSSELMIDNLLPSSTYKWQIRTICSFGFSVWSPLSAFKTTAEKLATVPGEFSISLYPNPAASCFTIRLSDPSTAIDNLKLFDLTGRVVKQVSPAENSEIKIQRDDLPSGIYLVKIKSGEQEQLTKVIFE